MMNEKVYQQIYDELDRFLPEGWEKLIVYLEFGTASYSFSFYVKSGVEYVKCFDLPNISEEDLDKAFSTINKIVSKQRNKEKEEWSNLTLIINRDRSSIRAEIDYTDLSEGSYQFMKEWKKKYLV